MADYFYLTVCGPEDRRQVSLRESIYPDQQALSEAHCRISPVFPVAAPAFSPPEFRGRWHFSFFSIQSPFQAIGALVADQPEKAQGLLFSHGLASLIFLSQERSAIQDVVSFLSPGLLAYECWDLEDGAIGQTTYRYQLQGQTRPDLSFTYPLTNLPVDFRAILYEFRFSLETALHRASREAPVLLKVFEGLFRTVDAIIAEVLYLAKKITDIPSTISAEFARYLLTHPVERQRRLNQRTDQIVQLNSALSYVISQTFAGAIPILERECQVRSYSLLGIGGAVLALSRFADSVQSVFERYPVHEALVARHSYLPGVPIFGSLRQFEPHQWSKRNLGIDTQLNGLELPSYRPKLVFFSGRLGFKESEFSVAAAIQSLASSDSTRWSLMTLSHELMHAHVRAILGSLFQDKREEIPSERFSLFYQEFERHLQNPDEDPPTLAQSLRSIILNYCLQKRSYDRIAERLSPESIDDSISSRGTIIEELKLPSAPVLRRWWQDEFRDINEILTHVLDFYYFYNADASTYLGLLWESWATVPTVLSEIDHYIFRSLVAVATMEEGTINERFSSAKSRLEACLQTIARAEESPVINEALEFVQRDQNLLPLRIRFTPALYLAEATVQFLKSRRIHSELVKNDPNFDIVDGEYTYTLNSGSFPGFEIVSPVAFIADRLKRTLDDSKSTYSERYRSAWAFLALSSLKVTDTEGGK